MAAGARPNPFVRAIGIALAALLLLAAVSLWWVGQTTSFLQWSLQRVAAASDGAFDYEGVRGSLLGGLRIDTLRWRDADRLVVMHDVSVASRPDRLLQRELRLTRVEIGRVELRLGPGPDSGEPPAAPASLQLPLDLRIDALGIGRLSIEPAQGEPVVLERISLSGQYRHGVYRIAHFGVVSPQWGEASGNGVLGDRSPHALEFELELAPRVPAVPRMPRIRALGDGTLEDFSLVAQALAPGAATAPPGAGSGPGAGSAPGIVHPVWIGLDTRVRPFAPSRAARFAPVEINFDGFEPAQVGLDRLPRMRLSGSARVRIGDEQVGGELTAENALPGPIDGDAIPVQALQGSFAWSGQRLELPRLRAALGEGGEIEGEASVDFARRLSIFDRLVPTVETRLAVRDLDVARIASRLDATRLRGRLRLEGTTLEADLSDAQRDDVALAARVTLAGELLGIERARLRTSAGTLSASGSTSIAAPYRIDLRGRFADFDPARARAVVEMLRPGGAAPGAPTSTQRGEADKSTGEAGTGSIETWLARLRGRIDGSWAAEGRAWPEPRLRTSVSIERGRLDERTVRLDWSGDVTLDRVADVALNVGFGEFRLRANGSLGRPGDRMRFSAAAASLSAIDARLSGSLRAEGELAGGWRDATLGVAADLAGERLAWGEAGRIGAISGRIAWPELQEAGRVDLDIVARAVQWGDRRIDRLRADVQGDIASHSLRIDASGEGIAGRVVARGSLTRDAQPGWRWAGRVEELAIDTPVTVKLESAADVVVDPAGVSLGSASLIVDAARVRLDAFSLRDGVVDTRGEAEPLPLGRWMQRFAPASVRAGGAGALDALRVAGRWNLNGSDWTALSGEVSVQLEAGANGEGRGLAQVALERGSLDGRLDLEIPTLAFANPMIGPRWEVAGRLRFDGRVGGTMQRPQLRGDLAGRELELMQNELGWRLAEGKLRARFEGDRLEVDELRLESGEGSVTMQGLWRLEDRQGDFRLRAERLPVPLGPGERVVVSGETVVSSRAAALRWSGEIRADEGTIELRGGDAPKLPDDVVIVGGGDASEATPMRTRAGDTAAKREKTNGKAAKVDEAAAPGDGLRVEADLTLDLGEELRVHGSGVDVLLAGKLALRGTLPSQPLAFGTVSVREGSYTAYGRRLTITRGRLIFDGPLDNPVLDIVAMRLEQPVEAGVALTGTVLSPRVRLVSKPEVPDPQKLSWLVLGVGLDDARDGAQIAALQVAAASLLGTDEGGGLSGGMAGALGLDVLTVRGASTGGVFDPDFGATFPGQSPAGNAAVPDAAQSVVAIGKRLGSRVLVTYEQGLRGIWSLLRIQYDITDRLSVRAQTGSETALDLLYFYSFD